MRDLTEFDLLQQASCEFLTEPFSDACIEREAQLEWVNDHKWFPFETYDDEAVLEYIEAAAFAWMLFLDLEVKS